MILDDKVFCDVRYRVAERLAQHTENLALWESGYLNPTEPDEQERECVKRELKAAIAELTELQKMWGIGTTKTARFLYGEDGKAANDD